MKQIIALGVSLVVLACLSVTGCRSEEDERCAAPDSGIDCDELDGWCEASAIPRDPDCVVGRPVGCVDDGVCFSACRIGPDMTELDPDCPIEGCSSDGVCHEECVWPLDPDCPTDCWDNGVCDPTCQPPMDPDCDPERDAD